MRSRLVRKGLVFGIALLMVFVVFAGMPMNVAAAGEYSSYFAGGTGTVGNPYQIANVDQLQNMNLDLAAHYIIINDIDASATSTWNSDGGSSYYGFEPVGDNLNGFTGSLDGQGYKITGLYINRPSTNGIGLFGNFGSERVVQDVSLIDCQITGNDYVGGLAGCGPYVTIDCCATGYVSGHDYVGGLVGVGRMLSNCHAGGTTSGNEYVGGLVGRSSSGDIIQKCHSTGDVIGTNRIGGLVGFNKAQVIHCSAIGDVSGNEYVGGLVGDNNGGGPFIRYYGNISNCYATGDVSGTDRVGGLVGYNHGVVPNSYATGSVSGNEYVGGLVGWNVRLWPAEIGGVVTDCYTTGDVDGVGHIGGIIGFNSGPVSDCYSEGSISGGGAVGGIIGNQDSNFVLNCYATGVISSYGCAGGLIGYHFSGRVANCYSTAQVSGQSDVGGLVGSSGVGIVSNCYATGNVIGVWNVGGLIGVTALVFNCYSTGTVNGMYPSGTGGLIGSGGASDSFWDTETSTQSTSYGGTGKTTSEMKDIATYTDTSTIGLDMPWDFSDDPNDDIGSEDIWDMDSAVNDGYPYLGWQITEDGGSNTRPVAVDYYVEFDAIHCFYGFYAPGSSYDPDGDPIEVTWQTTPAQHGTVFGPITRGNDQYFYYARDVGYAGIDSFTYNVFDGQDYSNMATVTINVKSINDPPMADAGGPYAAYTGVDITFDASASIDPNDDELQYRWDFENDGTWDTSYSTEPTATHSWSTDFSGTAKVEVFDGELTDIDTATIMVTKPFAGGDGSLENPYLISNVLQLQNMNSELEAHYIIINDIDASATSTWNSDGSGGYYGFEPIGDSDNRFTGSLDGQGYSITELFIHRPSEYNVGLFGYIDTGGSVINVNLIDNDVHGQESVGGLVGFNLGTVSNSYTTGDVGGLDIGGGLIGINQGTVSNSYSTVTYVGNHGGGLIGKNLDTVSNCYSTGYAIGNLYVGGLIAENQGTVSNSYSAGVVFGSEYAGGLIGENHGTISNCYAIVNMNEAIDFTGGLIGYNYGGQISNCYATGIIFGGREYVGGLFGYNYGGMVSNCYSNVVISGTDQVGGLIGSNYEGEISNCYATGSVSGTNSVGGLIGHGDASMVSNCFWDTDTSGQSSSAGGTGKTTVEMKDVVTYTDTDTVGLDSPWDFVGDPNDDTGSEDIWNINEGVNNGYPYFTWKITTAFSSWETPVTFRSGVYYEAMHTADVDGDGLVELLAGNWATNRVEVWDYDTSTETWSMVNEIQQSYSIRGITSGDYDEDGDIDIATAIRGNGIHIAFNQNPGWSSLAHINSEYGWLVTTSDLNNDDHLDILGSQIQHQRIYYGDGSGNFEMDHNPIGLDDGEPTPSLPTKGFFSTIDLDNDGDLDLTGTWFQGGWGYYPNDRMDYFLRGFINNGNDETGKVSWGASESEVLGFKSGSADGSGYGPNILFTPSGYGAGDVNEDGYIDIVAKNLNAETLVILLGYEDSTGMLNWQETTVDTLENVIFSLPYRDYPARSNCRLTDINGDSHLDIICSGFNQYDGLTIYYGDGTGGFTKYDRCLEYGLNADGQSSAIGDFNGDGLLDMALPRYTTGGGDSGDGFEVWLQFGNNPPEADANGPYETAEGSEITFDASGSSDPDGDELQYRWDFDNDGIWDTEYSTDPTATHTWFDDYTGEVAIEIFDGEYTDTDTAIVTINNVDPELTLSGLSTIDEGSVYTLGLNSYDPGDDTITEWEIAWGDGTVETIPGDPSFATHTYADGPNGYTISAKAFDEDCLLGSENTLITDYDNQRIIEVDRDYNIIWKLEGLKNPIDTERLDNGNTLYSEADWYGTHGHITEIDSTGAVVWEYDTGLNIPYDIERLPNGNTLVADQHNNRVFEVNHAKTIVWQVDTNLKNTGITYLHYPVDVERLDNGNTLIVDMYNDRIIEVEPDFDVVWETPFVGYLTYQDAERLDNGNTIICSSSPGLRKVFELDSGYIEKWSETISTYPTDVELLTNGNLLIADGMGGNRVFEIDRDGTIIWEPTGLGLNYPYDVERVPGSILPYDASNTIELTVNNIAPSVSAGTDQSVNEGDTVTFSGSFTDPGLIDTHSIEWDFGDGNIALGTLTPTHEYGDNGEYPVTLTVTDKDGGVGIDDIMITVNNVAPDVAAGSDQTVSEGEVVSFSGNFIDPGWLDTHNIDWDFGDGNTASDILNPTNVYGDNGVYTVELTVTDDDGGTDSNLLTITVLNIAPSGGIVGIYAGSEGEAISFSGTGTDIGSDDLTFKWNWGDGITDTITTYYNNGLSADPNQSPGGTRPFSKTDTASHIYTDNDEYTVTLTITDDDGDSDAYSIVIDITNIPPSINPFGPYTVDEGSIATATTTATDPGADDLKFTWSFQVGPTIINQYYSGGVSPVSETDGASHTYGDNGLYDLDLVVEDDDGGTNAYSTSITVNNVAPTVTAGSDQTVNEGETVSFIGSFTDPGWLDTHTIDWDFGDSESATGALSATHVYKDNGEYTVTLTITDDDGGVGIDILTITVNNVAPTVLIDSMIQPFPEFIFPTDVLEFTGSFTDPSILDTHTIEWDFGDGTSIVTGTLTPTHAYLDAGEYIVTLTVTDDDSDFGTDTFNIIVENPMDVSEGVIDDLKELEVPQKAEKEVNNAIKDIEKAMDEFEEGDFLKAFDKLEDAVDDLMDAQDDGADTHEVIDAIVDLVQGIVDQSMDNTIEMIGEDDKNVIKAQEKYDKALELLEDGKFDKAINQFEKAYKQIMKAHSKYVPAGYMDDLEERLVAIQTLKEGDISSKALKSLNKAEDKLEDAIEKASEGNLEKSLDKLEDAIGHLEDAEELGVETTDLIESIMEHIQYAVYEKIADAESVLMDANDKDIEKAWEFYNEALDLWAEGKYENAINKFERAVDKAEDALKD